MDDYLPGDNCTIKPTDFDSAYGFARHLIDLSKDKGCYNHCHRWRTKPSRKGFIEIVEIDSTPPVLRLCHKINEIMSPMAGRAAR